MRGYIGKSIRTEVFESAQQLAMDAMKRNNAGKNLLFGRVPKEMYEKQWKVSHKTQRILNPKFRIGGFGLAIKFFGNRLKEANNQFYSTERVGVSNSAYTTYG